MESTLLPFLLQQRPSRRLTSSTCFGLNVRVEYFYSRHFLVWARVLLHLLQTLPRHTQTAPETTFSSESGHCARARNGCVQTNEPDFGVKHAQVRAPGGKTNVLKNLLFLWDSTVWAFWRSLEKGPFWTFSEFPSSVLCTHLYSLRTVKRLWCVAAFAHTSGSSRRYACVGVCVLH